MRVSVLALIASSIVAGGCHTTGDVMPEELARTAVVSVQAPGASLPRGGSFHFAPGSGLIWAQAGEGRALDREIRRQIGAALASRGFVQTLGGPSDLQVAFIGGLESDLGTADLRSLGFSNDWVPPGEEAGRFEKGSLVILVGDGRSGRLLWRASAQGLGALELSLDLRVERLASVVPRMLERMPPPR